MLLGNIYYLGANFAKRGGILFELKLLLEIDIHTSPVSKKVRVFAQLIL